MNWRDLCRDRACIGCGVNDGTIVPAHSNQQAHGKGMGLKAGDWTVIPLCHGCHSWLDNSASDKELKRSTFSQWWTLHMMSLCQAELIAPIGQQQRDRKPQRLSKILPRSFPPEAA